MVSDLVIDPSIRIWVFVPIVLITFFVGILRYYNTLLFSTEKDATNGCVREYQVLARLKILKENGHFIPSQGFIVRKQNLVKKEEYLNPNGVGVKNVLTNPTVMSSLIKNNLSNVVPMIIVGGWINWMFSGFITTKIPFPLTLRYKQMLQRDIELQNLDASWVSSASWYFMNIFGLRGLYTLLFTKEEFLQDEDQSFVFVDTKALHRAECEALELITHEWALQNIENTMEGLINQTK